MKDVDTQNKAHFLEHNILDRAIQAMERETGVHLIIEQTNILVKGVQVDAVVRLGKGKKKFTVEIKKWAQQANLGALVNQIKQLPGTGLLVADYINPKMADKLRKQEVQFIDTAGNAFIDQAPVFIFVKGNREEGNHYTPIQGDAKRAFEPKGLMVTYAFLCNPELMNTPYREIAEHTGVAIGTVTQVVKALKAGGFIHEDDCKKRQFIDYRKLLNRWVEVWPEKLKPKYFVGEFVAEDFHWWEQVDLTKYGGCWGGETAAAKYTAYFNPQVTTIYMRERGITKLLQDARLRKVTDPHGDIAGIVLIYAPFWPQQIEMGKALDVMLEPDLVHPILVYADLIATADPRNREVANKIYDDHIA